MVPRVAEQRERRVEVVAHAAMAHAYDRERRHEHRPDLHAPGDSLEDEVVVPVPLVAVAPRVELGVPRAPVVTLHAVPAADLDGLDSRHGVRALEAAVGMGRDELRARQPPLVHARAREGDERRGVHREAQVERDALAVALTSPDTRPGEMRSPATAMSRPRLPKRASRERNDLLDGHVPAVAVERDRPRLGDARDSAGVHEDGRLHPEGAATLGVVELEEIALDVTA